MATKTMRNTAASALDRSVDAFMTQTYSPSFTEAIPHFFGVRNFPYSIRDLPQSKPWPVEMIEALHNRRQEERQAFAEGKRGKRDRLFAYCMGNGVLSEA